MSDKSQELKKYRIFAGLGGGFGGAEEHGVYECETEEQAERFAFEQACETYESHVGMHGLRTLEQIMEEDEVDYKEAEDIYDSERESWLEYHVEQVQEEKRERPDDVREFENAHHKEDAEKATGFRYTSLSREDLLLRLGAARERVAIFENDLKLTTSLVSPSGAPMAELDTSENEGKT